MRLAIMQPYFLPYIGYFQLINVVDKFVIYDNIEYTKKGWINRNRILVNGKDEYITIPLKKDSDYLAIKDRYLADTWKLEKVKMLNRIRAAYMKAPHFSSAYPVIEKAVLCDEDNLFKFIYSSIQAINDYLEIDTPLLLSSEISINHNLRSENKVISIATALKADTYINPIGGIELYNKENFNKEKIELNFLKSSSFTYKQFDNVFIPSLSIIDAIMFNSTETIQNFLDNYYSLI